MDDYIYGFEFTVNGYYFTITKLMTAKSDNVYTSFPVAEIDYCPARYYLQWRDRYGSMQMQPFCKIDTYSEDLTRTEIKNYQDNRSLSNISIQPKWKLNTKWLNNTVYPYYESLLVFYRTCCHCHLISTFLSEGARRNPGQFHLSFQERIGVDSRRGVHSGGYCYP